VKSIVTICLSLGLASTFAQAQIQNSFFLDPYFGNAGVQVGTNPPWGNLQYRTYNVRTMTIGADDKIVFSGNQTPNFSPLGISGGHYAITRMKADGSMDSSFAVNGHKVFSSGDNGNPILTMDVLKILPDGKMLYAGIQMSNPFSKYVVFKVNTDGSFDNTFGANGRAVISAGTAMWHGLYALGIQNTGKILLLGGNGDNSNPWIGSISRLATNGSLDNSFGTNGVLIPNLGFNSNNVRYEMIKVLSDNSFLVVGTHIEATTSADITHDFVAKFDADGTLETNFGTNGKVILPLINNERLYFLNQDIEVDNNGNIYINCSTTGGSTGVKSVLVYKLNNIGILQNNYGLNGRLTVPNLVYDSWYKYDALLQGDKLLVAGMTDTGRNAPYSLQRINADGTADLTFANPFNELTANRASYDHLYYLGLQSNERIMLGGNGKPNDKAADSIFPIVLRFLEQGTEVPPTTDTGTSVVNIKDQNVIKVYPNPTRDLLHIEGIKENFRVQLFDISGKLVLSRNIKSTQPINCSQLPSGTYWLYLKADNSQTIYVHKLVKH
jgi:uncharacterized delta-60 repeat protein